MVTTFQFPTDQYIKVGDINTRYWSMGENGDAVLFIHGFGTSVELWQHNLPVIARHHRVCALDLVGFGRSDKFKGPYSLDMMTDFIDGFVNVMGIGKTSLVGLSMGGGLALKYALKFPQKVNKLVLADSAGFGTEMIFSLRLMTLPYIGEKFTKASRKTAYLFFKPAVKHSSILKGKFTDKYYELFSLPGAQESMLKVLRSFCTILGPKKSELMPVIANLDKISSPTLILWGRDDEIVPLKHAFFGKEKIGNSRIHVFEDCGHMPNFEKPEEFNQIVLEFLAE